LSYGACGRGSVDVKERHIRGSKVFDFRRFSGFGSSG
jgi:hypothetical protein